MSGSAYLYRDIGEVCQVTQSDVNQRLAAGWLLLGWLPRGHVNVTYVLGWPKSYDTPMSGTAELTPKQREQLKNMRRAAEQL